jgi:hypothetical protein
LGCRPKGLREVGKPWLFTKEQSDAACILLSTTMEGSKPMNKLDTHPRNGKPRVHDLKLRALKEWLKETDQKQDDLTEARNIPPCLRGHRVRRLRN